MLAVGGVGGRHLVAHKAGIIGLGVVGRRTAANMAAHPDFEIVAAWDLSPEACEAARSDIPGIVIAADAGAVIESAADFVYVATPPLAHHDYVIAVIEAGKAIFCEKPLGIDVAQSRTLTERVEASGVASAVNFVFGGAPGAVALVGKAKSGALGAIKGIDIRLHFATWPRGWQEAAQWLTRRDQGGFSREVLSHFIFLVERILGPAEIAGASVHYPGDGPGNKDAETAIVARLEATGVQITVAGGVGGAGPDRVECTVWGEEASCRLTDWYLLSQSDGDGGGWVDQLADIADHRAAAYRGQLDNLAAMLDGRAHTMPSFREALRVQETIEALLDHGDRGDG